MSHSPTKKIWAGALSALLALFAALVVATPAYAAEGDVSVSPTPTSGTETYESLEAAFSAISGDTQQSTFTVTLNNSISLSANANLYGEKTVTLIAGSNTVTMSANMIVLGPKDNSTPATLTVSGGVFKGSPTSQMGLFMVQNGSSLTLNRVNATASSNAVVGVMGAESGESTSNLYVYNSTLTAENGICINESNILPSANVTVGEPNQDDSSAISGSLTALYQSATGTVTINGGKLTGAVGIANIKGDITINGGTVEGTGANSGSTTIGSNGLKFPNSAVSLANTSSYQGNQGSVTLNGGTVENTKNTSVPTITNTTGDGNNTTNKNGQVSVAANGNVFSVGGDGEMPTDYLPKNYIQVDGTSSSKGKVQGFAESGNQNQLEDIRTTMTQKLGVPSSGAGSPVAKPVQGGAVGPTALPQVAIVLLGTGEETVVNGTDFQSAVDTAMQQLEEAGKPGIVYTYNSSTNTTGLPVGYGEGATSVDTDVDTAVTGVQAGFQSTAANADKAINAAMGTSGVDYVPDEQSNVMWAVVSGVSNTLGSVQFSFENAQNQQSIVFANTNLPVQGATDGVSSWFNGTNGQYYGKYYVPIGNKGKGVVWFSMVKDAGGVSALGQPNNASLGYMAYNLGGSGLPAGTPYPNQNPICANYTVTAWSAGKAWKTPSATGTVGVNAVSYWYTDPIDGEPVAFTGATAPAYNPDKGQFDTQYAQVGDQIYLSTGAQVTDPRLGTITSWTSGSDVYPINDQYTMPEPSEYKPVPMTAVFGETVTLNLNTTDRITQFPTGGGDMFVDSTGAPWLNNAIATSDTLLVGTAQDGTLPALPGVQGWDAQVYNGSNAALKTAIANLFPSSATSGTAAAFVGWYSWDNEDGYRLWEAGDVVPQYANLQLYPLFAPVSATWAPAEPTVPSTTPLYDEYDYDAWTAPGLTGQYTLTVATDASGLNEVLNVPADIETSQAAADLLQVLAHKAMPAQDTSLTGANPIFVNQYGISSSALKGATATYTGTTTGPLTFSVYVPAGMKGYGKGAVAVNFPLIGSNGTTSPYANGFGSTSTTLVTSATVDVVQVFIDVNPQDAGTVTVRPIESGEQAGMVEITAVPATGYAFDHWSIIGGATPQGVDMNAVTIVVPDNSGEWVANFVPGESNTVDVIRLYNPFSGEHLYTSDPNEASTLENDYGWDNENVAWVAPANSATPIYRLYNPYNGDHLYTVSLDEYNTLQQPNYGWQGEGVKLYSAPTTGAPIYRLFNPYMTANAGAYAHLWTGDYNEYVTLGREGWQQESVAFYAISVPNPS